VKGAAISGKEIAARKQRTTEANFVRLDMHAPERRSSNRNVQ
jgi:hypothetical protein